MAICPHLIASSIQGPNTRDISPGQTYEDLHRDWSETVRCIGGYDRPAKRQESSHGLFSSTCAQMLSYRHHKQGNFVISRGMNHIRGEYTYRLGFCASEFLERSGTWADSQDHITCMPSFHECRVLLGGAVEEPSVEPRTYFPTVLQPGMSGAPGVNLLRALVTVIRVLRYHRKPVRGVIVGAQGHTRCTKSVW